MNRNISILVICAILLVWSVPSFGCLSNTINIGIPDTERSRLSAELILQIINERTGTNVRLLIYNSEKELNEALTVTDRDYRIDLLAEELGRFTQIAESENITILQDDADADSYEKKDSVSFIQTPLVLGNNAKGDHEATIFYRSDLLQDYPLLPRLLQKLSGALDIKSYKLLLQYVEDGRKPKNVARDFLRKKHLI